MEQNNITTDEVVETNPQIDETAEIKRTGVMGDMINRYKDKTTIEPKDTPEVKAESAEEKKYDYSFFKDLTNDDYEKYADLKTKDESLYYELLTNRNEMKKNQRLVSQREVELAKAKEPSEAIKKYDEFFNGLKKDFFGTYKKHQTEFNLPDLEFINRQIETGGDLQSRLQQWQANDLIVQIEKRFKLDNGDFIYDPADAYKAGTPSYEYRIATERKEKEMQSEYDTQETNRATAFKKIAEEREKDLMFLKDTYYKDNEDEFVSLLGEMDTKASLMREGNFSSDANPFAIKNLFRGVFFDKLLAKSNEMLANKIHQEYNSKGMFLPSNGKEKFLDSTNIKGGTTDMSIDTKPKFGAMSRSFSRYKN